MELEYIVAATNRLYEVRRETVALGRADLERVFAIGCNTLSRVIEDIDFLENLQQLSKNQQKFWDDYQKICGDVDHFVRGFCRIEKRLLIEAGIKEPVAKSLIQEVIALRDAIVTLRLNPNLVHDDTVKLCDTTCHIAKRLHDVPIEQEERRKLAKTRRKLAAGIGGVAIVVINASAIVATVGLSAAGTAVSGAVGSGLIGAAVVID